MALSINTNVASLAAQRSLGSSNSALETSFERLATGKRINSASDDAAGLAVAQRMTSRINGSEQGIRNVNDGISVTSIAEGALDEVTSLLQRMRDLAVQAANGSMSTDDKTALNNEATQLKTAIDNVAGSAKFGSVALLGATYTTNGFVVHYGADTADTFSFTIGPINQTALTMASVTLTGTFAAGSISTIDTALKAVSDKRAALGGVQARLEATARNLANVNENMQAARSRIEDTDYAAETANLTKNQILQQASTSILAQANQQPQSVLALLQ